MPSVLDVTDKMEIIRDLAVGEKQTKIAEDYGVAPSAITRIKKQEAEKIERLKLQLSERIAEKLVEHTVKELEFSTSLLKHEINPSQHGNYSLYQDANEINQVQSRLSKTVSELRKSLGFIPSQGNNYFFQQNNNQTNNLAINPDVFASMGQFIKANLDADTE